MISGNGTEKWFTTKKFFAVGTSVHLWRHSYTKIIWLLTQLTVYLWKMIVTGDKKLWKECMSSLFNENVNIFIGFPFVSNHCFMNRDFTDVLYTFSCHMFRQVCVWTSNEEHYLWRRTFSNLRNIFVWLSHTPYLHLSKNAVSTYAYIPSKLLYTTKTLCPNTWTKLKLWY